MTVKNVPSRIEPLVALSGKGDTVRAKGRARPRSSGEAALMALDAMATGRMRAEGLLPPTPVKEATNDAMPQPSQPFPDIERYDPMQMPVWTLLMALAWIDSRDVERVTWQRDDWRRANGKPEGRIPTVSFSAREGLEGERGDIDPTAFRALDAFASLKAAGEGNKIEVRAMASGRAGPVTLRSVDWTYGKLSFDNRLNEVWRVGGEFYHTLTVLRDNLLLAFPPIVNDGLGHKLTRASFSNNELPRALSDLLSRSGTKTKAILLAAWELWRGPPPFYDGIGRRDDALFAKIQTINPDFRTRPDRETFRKAIEKYTAAISSEIPPH